MNGENEMSPLGEKGLADHLVGRSKSSVPGGALIWMLYVSDQLVEAAGEDWSRPVQFQFRWPDNNGVLEMWMRESSVSGGPFPGPNTEDT